MARIVSIHAHPDDAEILAGGTLALLGRLGHHLTIVTMTPGDKGSSTLSPTAIAEVRRAEARASAAIIGAEYYCAEFRDLEIFNDHSSRQRMVEWIRRLRPDVILTSAPVDYLCDHEMTSTLVRDACFGAPNPNYRTGAEQPAPVFGAIPHLYYMDPIGGVDRDGKPVLPDFLVDVSSTFSVKRQMLAAHESQRQWLKEIHGMDNYLDTMERWTESCGRRAGLKFGEGFRHYKGHPYPETPLLENLLQGYAVRL